jgi:restriction system protein
MPDRDELLARLLRLDEQSQLAYGEAEEIVVDVLRSVLGRERYTVTWPAPREYGVDGVAEREQDARHSAHVFAIEFKFRKEARRVDIADVRQLLGTSIASGFDRAVLFSNGEFTPEAQSLANRELPTRLELVTLRNLTDWVNRLDTPTPDTEGQIRAIVREISRRFAEMIAKDPFSLDHLEWRDVERTVAEVFRALGFRAELTPPAKDGGKDVVLEYRMHGQVHSHIVEIKHWRSGKRVGSEVIADFLKVVLRERRTGGLVLSSYGYTANAFEQLSQIERQRLRFGSSTKIVALCRTYERVASGLLSPPENLAAVIHEDTE